MRLEGGMRLGRRAVVVALLHLTAGEHRRFGGLAQHDLRVRHFLLKHAPDALQRAAGAESGHPVVELLLEIADDLARGGAGVHVGIGLVLELARHEPTVLFGKLLRLVDHTQAASRRGRQDHSGAKEAHQLAPLDGKRLGHGADKRIALGGAHHGEPDTGVAGGRFDHRLAGLQLARFFRGLDHAEREAILH